MRTWLKNNITQLLIWTCTVIVVAGGLVVAGAYVFVQQHAARQIDQKLNVIADTNTGALLRYMEVYGDVLYTMRGLFAAADVDTESWYSFVRSQSVPDRFMGMKSVAYAEMVPQQNTVAFTQSLQQMYGSDVTIYPAKDTGDYVVLTYHEDLAMTAESHRETLGFDLASEAVRSRALQQAVASGEMVATEVLPLVSTGSQGFLLLLPLTERYGQPSGGEVFGYAVVAIDIGEFVDKALRSQLDRNEVSLTITDQSGGQPQVLYADAMPDQRTETREVTVQVADRTWQVAYTVPVSSLLTAAERFAAAGILVLGMISVFLVSMFAYVLRLRYRLRCVVTQKE